MAEQINLITPDQAVAGTSDYYIAGLIQDRDAVRVEIRLNSSGGYHRTFTFTGNDAKAYMSTLNQRNASIVSNDRWTLNQLKSKGYLSGTISGTPD